MSDDTHLPLSPFRVLDLTDERGLLCGQILADLGADVVAVEPPGGSSARRIGPFFGDTPDPEKSIYWWAYSRNKRSITLDFTTARGRELLLGLVRTTDFLIDTAIPGQLTQLGIGYEQLSHVNPRLIHVSITPFGQQGPSSLRPSSDLTVLAASGVLALTGDEDRPPIRLRVPQSDLHAAADAAVGALIALHERARSGIGQHVDVSAQQSAALATQSAILAAVNGSVGLRRMSGGFNLGPVRIPAVWRVADGYVTLTVLFGQGFAAFTQRLMRYLYDAGGCDASLLDEDWVTYGTRLMSGAQRPEHYQHLMESIARFVAVRTKAHLFDAALEHRLLLAPIATMADVLASPHLMARAYWCAVEHPELDRSVIYPGPFARMSKTPIQYRLRPPLIGEHNTEILGRELKLTTAQRAELKRAGVV